MKQFIKHPSVKSITVYSDGDGYHALQVDGADEVYPFAEYCYVESISSLLEGNVFGSVSLSDYRRRRPDSIKILTVKFK